MRVPCAAIVVAASMLTAPVIAFTSTNLGSNLRHSVALADAPPALGDYLAKAHEEKLRAIKDVEDKKNMEIEALKKEIDELKGQNTLAPSTVNLADAPKEDIAAKLLSYQQFMAKYIVDSHQQKVAAVQAAERAVAKQYEEKMKLLTGGTAPAAVATSASTPAIEPAPPSESKHYAERSAKVSAAAKAGKSRWGDMENAKASGKTLSSPPAPTRVVAPTAKATNVGAAIVNGAPPEVVAADKGLRAEGVVAGFTLAERVAMGTEILEVNGKPEMNGKPVNGAAPVTLTQSPPVLTVYQQRNAKISAAAKVGKSRWGSRELQRLESTSLPSFPAAPVPVPVPPEVLAADHGLRADGGVGGPTLAQRVNLGARLLGD